MSRFCTCIYEIALLYLLAIFLVLLHDLQTQSSVGDFIFYLQNDRPASELLSAIWNIYYRKYRKRLPVNVTTNMKFSRPNVGIREGVLFSDPGQTKTAKSPSFIKVSGGQNRVSIVWPDDSAVSANPRSYL